MSFKPLKWTPKPRLKKQFLCDNFCLLVSSIAYITSCWSLTTGYPATAGNLFLRIRRSLKINAQGLPLNGLATTARYRPHQHGITSKQAQVPTENKI